MRKRVVWACLISLAILYVGSYLVLSRRGYEEARQYNMKGFYYFTPEDTNQWLRLNYSLVYFYYPLNVIDVWLGTGLPPGCAPLFRLSK
jgi:hypothetical protein